MESKLRDDALYLGDNGRAFCGHHAGATARYTGRDLSGQPVHRLTPSDVQAMLADYGIVPRCESCGAEANIIHAT